MRARDSGKADGSVGHRKGDVLYTHFGYYLQREYENWGRKCSQVSNEVLDSGLKGIWFTTEDNGEKQWASIRSIKRNPVVKAKGGLKHVVFWDGKQVERKKETREDREAAELLKEIRRSKA